MHVRQKKKIVVGRGAYIESHKEPGFESKIYQKNLELTLFNNVLTPHIPHHTRWKIIGGG